MKYIHSLMTGSHLTKCFAAFLGLASTGLVCSTQAQTAIGTPSIRIDTQEVFREPGGNPFGTPTGYVADPLGNQLISDQSGRIFNLNSDGTLGSSFLDLRSETIVRGGGEGLLSFTLHPDYDSVGAAGYRKLYTFNTVLDDGNAVDFNEGTQGAGDFVHLNLITEWTVDATGTRVDANSRREVLRAGQAGNQRHSGGSLVFDGQGYLNYTFGLPLDSQAQDPTNLYGSAIRIDPIAPELTVGSGDSISNNGAYRVPVDNPFVGNGAVPDEVFAYGFRSPFRSSFDEQSGLIFIGDVGAGTREEINVLSAGGNFGFGAFEGSLQVGSTDELNDLGTLTAPIADYGRELGRSVIGGFVYRGSAIPELQGKYVFGDLTSNPEGPFFSAPGSLFYIDVFDEDGELRDPSEIEINEFIIDNDEGTPVVTITTLGLDDQGEIIVGGVDGNRTVFLRLLPSSTPIPEPATISLLLIGSFLAANRRRKLG